MTEPIHKMTDAELDAAIEQAEDAYADADPQDEPRWADRWDALQRERDSRDESGGTPHDEHVGLDVPAGYSS